MHTKGSSDACGASTRAVSRAQIAVSESEGGMAASPPPSAIATADGVHATCKGVMEVSVATLHGGRNGGGVVGGGESGGVWGAGGSSCGAAGGRMGWYARPLTVAP